MGKGSDHDFTLADPIDDMIAEPSELRVAKIFLPGPESLGVCQNPVNHLIYIDDEALGDPQINFTVIPDGVSKLFFCWR